MSDISLDTLCIHTVTTKPWSLRECVENFSAQGVRGISVWKELLENCSVKEARALLHDHALTPVALCRGGFFVSGDKSTRDEAVARNMREVEMAYELGARTIVLVCGACPTVPLPEARKHIADGIAAVLSAAEQADVHLAIEPLHPMYADARSAVTTLKQANDMCDALASKHVGVAVDVYHTWWDEYLKSEIERSGRSGYLKSFHICDWRTPTEDMLSDRTLMGEGCIPIKQIRQWVRDAGFEGFDEVEIFSTRYWAGDQHEFLQKIIEAYKNTC